MILLIDEYFGFSDREVMDMLRFYGLEQKYELIKEWYDGYRFGDADVPVLQKVLYTKSRNMNY